MQGQNKFLLRPESSDIMSEREHFIEMLNHKAPGRPEHTADIWDQRAERWEKEDIKSGKIKSEDRVLNTVEYLIKNGLIDSETDVADVGCGQGRFVAAFAKTARYVMGIDFSEKMTQYGKALATKEQLQNTEFMTCDFQELNLAEANLIGRFDLVFSFNTPAIHGMNGLMKLMQMSRKFCVNITHVSSENDLETRLMRELFDRERQDPWDAHWLYVMFNVLFLHGYYPEISYYRRKKALSIVPDSDSARYYMKKLLPKAEHNEENVSKIQSWLLSQTVADGKVLDQSDILYGRLLWDVRM